MAFVGSQTVIQTTATPLFDYSANTGTETNQVPFLIEVPSGATQTVFVGGEGVTTGSGYPLTPGKEYTFGTIAGEVLFGITSSPQVIYILQGRF